MFHKSVIEGQIWQGFNFCNLRLTGAHALWKISLVKIDSLISFVVEDEGGLEPTAAVEGLDAGKGEDETFFSFDFLSFLLHGKKDILNNLGFVHNISSSSFLLFNPEKIAIN